MVRGAIYVRGSLLLDIFFFFFEGLIIKAVNQTVDNEWNGLDG